MLETYLFLMVRPKIAYWEFDFEAMCPTLDHNLLSQVHIYTTSFQMTAIDSVEGIPF